MTGDQLRLEIDASAPSQPLPQRIRPMQPAEAPAPFDDARYFFEPWWPGARALVSLERGRLSVQIDHLSDPMAAFPELHDVTRQLSGDGLLLDGTLLVLDDAGRPDGELLRRRLERPGPGAGHAALVAADVLYAEGKSQLARAFRQRRDVLATLVSDGDWCVLSRGLHGEGVTLAAAAASMGIAEVSARRLDARYRAGAAVDEWLRLPVVETPSAERRPLLTLLQRLPL